MISLRPYQQDLVRDIRDSINHGKHSVCAVLGCGGGKSVIAAEIARLATNRDNPVLFLVHRRELCDQIARTFNGQGVNPQLCDIGMVQTVTRRLARMREPKLIIQDEAHHALSDTYKRIYAYWPQAKLVGFTATPVRMNEGGLGPVFEELVESVSTKWLIDHHYLAPYKYYGVQLADASKLHTRHGDYCKEEVEQLMDQHAIFGATVENWQRIADGRQTIVYCSSVKTSQATAQEFLNYGITAAHLDGTTPEKIRQATVDQFRAGSIRVLCNVDLFGEGFDVPDCEAVVLLRPTKSLTLFIQQSMRSMRYKDGKTALILDHVGNYTRHGLPDDTHEWSLAAKKKKKKSSVLVKQCPQCFMVVHNTEAVCPYCGYVFAPQERSETEVVDGVLLEEIKRRPYDDYRKAKTWDELRLFQQAKGYKFLWAIHKAVELGIEVPGKYRWMTYRMEGIRNA